MNSDFIKRREYFADTGKLVYEEHRTVCCKPYKVDASSTFLRHLERAVLEEKLSPDAVCGRAKLTGEFAETVCTKTVYNYIDLGIICIKSIDLPLRVRRNNKRHHRRQNRRILGEPRDSSGCGERASGFRALGDRYGRRAAHSR